MNQKIIIKFFNNASCLSIILVLISVILNYFDNNIKITFFSIFFTAIVWSILGTFLWWKLTNKTRTISGN